MAELSPAEQKIQVTLDGDAVDNAVLRAITESAFGEKLEEAINQEIESMTRSTYSSTGILRSAVQQEMRSIVIKVLREEYQEQMESLIKEKVTQEMIEGLFAKLWESFSESRF